VIIQLSSRAKSRDLQFSFGLRHPHLRRNGTPSGMKQHARALLLPIFLAAVLPFLASRNMVTPPQPPSLYPPKRVTNLTAARIGNEVNLHWTMPKRATDR